MGGQQSDVEQQMSEFTENQIVTICHDIARDIITSEPGCVGVLLRARHILGLIKEMYEDKGHPMPFKVIGGVIAITAAGQYRNVDPLLLIGR
jgi:hypothetical protein